MRSALLDGARVALAEVDQAVDEARRAARSGQAVLAIGHGPFSRSPAARLIEAVTAARPDLALRLEESVTPDLLERVATHELAAAATLETPAAVRRYAVPGPGRVLFQGAFASFNPHAPTRVDFSNDDRAPLLLIAGEVDHTVPAVVDRSTAKHYRKSAAVTEYKEFPGRSHFIVGQEGWEEVADYALDWAVERARRPAPSN